MALGASSSAGGAAREHRNGQSRQSGRSRTFIEERPARGGGRRGGSEADGGGNSMDTRHSFIQIGRLGRALGRQHATNGRPRPGRGVTDGGSAVGYRPTAVSPRPRLWKAAARGQVRRARARAHAMGTRKCMPKRPGATKAPRGLRNRCDGAITSHSARVWRRLSASCSVVLPTAAAARGRRTLDILALRACDLHGLILAALGRHLELDLLTLHQRSEALRQNL